MANLSRLYLCQHIWRGNFADEWDRAKVVDLIEEMKANMREQDEADLLVSCGDIDYALIASIESSEFINAIRDFETNELLCILGVCFPEENHKGRSIWMVGTKHLNKMTHVKNLLMKEAKELIECWVKKYGLLYNCVCEDNLKSIRYMTWLGAKWLPEVTECNGKKFYNFYIAGGEQ